MGNGLKFSTDIDDWRRWQERRSTVRRVRTRIRHTASPQDATMSVVRGGPDADICIVVDATHASVAAALLEPLHRFPTERTVVVLGPGVSLDLGLPQVRTSPTQVSTALRGVTTVLGSGHYTPAGAAVWDALPHAQSFVSQHGALTPFAPPLPDRTTVLSWTQRDGDFWRSGRSGVAVQEVGSQLLWRAGSLGRTTSSGAPKGHLVYLGQGHAAEISRTRMVEAALTFCRSHGAEYRPHPSETDRVSRLAHRALQRAGVSISAGSAPLAELESPVVSVFSTGVLEAAARGRDAWVDFPRPPAWLAEFWDRYGMSRFGSGPTPPPKQPLVEPAQLIADTVMGAAG